MTDLPARVIERSARFIIVDSLEPHAPVTPSAGSAFWIVLEKFGFLDFRLASLNETFRIDGDIPFIVIIPNAIVKQLSASDLSRLSQLGASIFIEGPYDVGLGELLGVHTSGQSCRAAKVEIQDAGLRRAVLVGLSSMVTPSNSGALRELGSLAISPRVQRQRAQSGAPSSFSTVNERACEGLSWGVRRTRGLPEVARRDIAVARLPGGDEAFPLLFQSGLFLVSTFEILTYIMEDYTSTYLENTYEFSNDRYPIEFILIWLLRQRIGTAPGAPTAKGLLAARIAPWPRGAQIALTVRHDVDRIPGAEDAKRLLAAYAQAGVRVTAFFLGRTATDELVRTFKENGAEIAYHSEYLEPLAAEELAAIERASGAPVAGSSVHGNAGFYGWRGVANWEVYREMGFAYAENLSSMRYLPSRMFRFDADGRNVCYPFVGLPHHFSFEKSKVEHFRLQLAAAMDGINRNEVCFILLNHPDLHINELISFINKDIPSDRVDMTIREVADWWSQTHLTENFRYELRTAGDGLLEVATESAQPIFGLTFEIPGHLQVEEMAIIPKEPDEPLQQRLRYGCRRAVNALAGECTRVWFDVPRGSHRIRLRLATEAGAIDWCIQEEAPTGTFA